VFLKPSYKNFFCFTTDIVKDISHFIVLLFTPMDVFAIPETKASFAGVFPAGGI